MRFEYGCEPVPAEAELRRERAGGWKSMVNTSPFLGQSACRLWCGTPPYRTAHFIHQHKALASVAWPHRSISVSGANRAGHALLSRKKPSPEVVLHRDALHPRRPGNQRQTPAELLKKPVVNASTKYCIVCPKKIAESLTVKATG